MTRRIATVGTLVTEICSEARPFVALEHVVGGEGRLISEWDASPMNPPESGAASIEPGDVLFGKLRPYLRKSLLVEAPVHASTELLAIRPAPAIDSRWLSYLVASQPFIDWSVASSEGSKMPRTSWAKIRELRTQVPGFDQQRRIADFLDAETARIDALIAAKQQMVALGWDRYASFVAEQLTVGEFEWMPFRRLMTCPPAYGASESGELVAAEASWPRYIRITDITDQGRLRGDGVKYLSPEVAQPFLLEDLDLLFARSGATVGKAFLYRSDMGRSAFAGYLVRVRVAAAMVDPRLLIHWTQSAEYWEQVRRTALQATIENVSAERYKDLRVPIPRLDQQPEILRRLDDSRSRIEKVATTLSRQVELLRERRQALITAAVTGELVV